MKKVFFFLFLSFSISFVFATVWFEDNPELIAGKERIESKVKSYDSSRMKIELNNVYVEEGETLKVFLYDEEGYSDVSSSVLIYPSGSKVPHVFENIKSGAIEEGIESMIEFNSDGELIRLDLTARKDTSFIIEGDSIFVPKDSRIIFDKEKGEIFLFVEPGGRLIAPKKISDRDNENSIVVRMKDNSMVYFDHLPLDKAIFRNGKLSLNEGEELLVDGYFIVKANENIPDLIRRLTFTRDQLTAKGTGLEISFSSINADRLDSINLPISLSQASNRRFFRLGDRGEDVKNIQKIVGLNGEAITGEYDELTKRAVIAWQSKKGISADGLFGEESLRSSYGVEEIKAIKTSQKGSRGEEVKELQGFLNEYVGSKLSTDGVFGTQTEEAVKLWHSRVYASSGKCIGEIRNGNCIPSGSFGYESQSEAAKSFRPQNVVVGLNGGSAIMSNNRKEGINILLSGETSVQVGSRSYSFDGTHVNKRLVNLLDYRSVETPTRIVFKTGLLSREEIILSSDQSQVGHLNLNEAASRIGINPSASSCAAFVTGLCPFVFEGESNGFVGSGISIAERAGIFGNAWEMQQYMINKKGVVTYSREESLSPEQKARIKKLEEEMKQRYNELTSGRDLSSAEKDRIRIDLSNQMRRDLVEIYGNNADLHSQVSVERGDVISFFYNPSSYLSTALIEGKGGQKNTHVGMITGYRDEVISFKEGNNLVNIITSRLGVEGSSLATNKYSYIDSEGFVRELFFKEGVFVTSNGDLFDSSANIIVSRPQVSHMIHYPGESGDPFHTEPLDKVISRSTLSLYGVTRPAQSDYLEESFYYAQVPSNPIKTDCDIINCEGLNLVQVLKANGVEEGAERWASALVNSAHRVANEAGLSEDLIPDLVALSTGIIERESSFGFGNRIRAKKLSDGVLGFLSPSKAKGYAQMHESTAQYLAEKYGDTYRGSSDLWTPEGSAKYSQRLLADTISLYFPGKTTPFSEDELRLIAITYNSGVLTPRNAALQSQLRDLGYIEEDREITGNIGEQTKKGLVDFARAKGLTISERDVPVLLGLENKDNFENSELYRQIKREWQERFKEEPSYAVLPEYSTSVKGISLLGTITSRGYSTQVANFARQINREECILTPC